MRVSALLIATALPLASLAAASAAKAQEVDWTGLYAGATAGLSWGDTSTRLNASLPSGASVIPPADINTINAFTPEDSNDTKFLAAIEGGYNYQNGWLVLGVETDFGLLNIDKQTVRTFQSASGGAVPPTVNLNQRVTTDWIWTLRPRVGYASGPWLVYVTGGLATTKVKHQGRYTDNRLPPNDVSLAINDTKTGWVGGLGGAYAFGQWSMKAEWLYTDFGHIRGSAPVSSTALSLTSDASIKANILRVGLDYRF